MHTRTVHRMARLAQAVAGFALLLALAGCGDNGVDPANGAAATDAPFPLPSGCDTLDLDGNGTGDCLLEYHTYITCDIPPSGETIFFDARPLGGAEVQYTPQLGPAALEDSVRISDASGWTPYPVTLASISWRRARGWDADWRGPFVQPGPRCLGLRVKRGAAWHYCWVKLAVSSIDGSRELLGSACSPQPDTPILAGVRP
jgi:hypothetical protein